MFLYLDDKTKRILKYVIVKYHFDEKKVTIVSKV